MTDAVIVSDPEVARRAARDRDARLLNPFPGLRPFRTGEEHLFFGRENQTDAMVDKLAATRFLAVIGSSGSGKSSLVNCGLRVALRAGLMAEAGTAWRIAQCRPGADPINALARALAVEDGLFTDFRPDGLALEDIVGTNLRMSRLGLVDVVEQARLGDGVNVLIVVDQFEELFRFRRSGAAHEPHNGDADGDAAAFVALLLEAARQRSHRIHVVLTMRSDFLGDCASLPGLAEAINEGQYLVPRMTREERRLAITGPLDVAGVGIQPVLLTRLLNDLGDDPDQLSILQHALNRIRAVHIECDGGEGRLGLAHYSRVGSMANALDRHAETVWEELADERQRLIAERVFKALTDTSSDSRGVRRPTGLKTLCALCDVSAVEVVAVVDAFRRPDRSFLMPPADELLVADSIVDISHESLMRTWHRLVAWADEEAASASTYRRLLETAHLHERGAAGLWRDPDLARALEWREHDRPNSAWADRQGGDFGTAMRFLEQSADAAEVAKARRREEQERSRDLHQARAVAVEQQARIEAQGRAARVQRKVTRIVTAGLVVTTLLSLGIIAQTLSKRDAQRLEAKADALRIAAQDEADAAQATKANVVDALVSDRIRLATNEYTLASIAGDDADESIKSEAIWQLIERELVRGEVPASVAFRNARDGSVLVLRLDNDGFESSPTVLEAGATRVLQLFENDVWVARAVSSGRIVDAGIVEDSDVILSN